IHRVRERYDNPMDEHEGTTRADLFKAATSAKLGLSAHEMSTQYSDPNDALATLKQQLDKKRLVLLEGITGVEGKGPSVYIKAMKRAYDEAIASGQSLYHASYPFYGAHSILVLGRDADGRYVVGDPMSEVGFVAISAEAMKDYMSRGTHRGTGVS